MLLLDLPNARGFIERMQEVDSGVLTISSWLLSRDGPFEAVFCKWKKHRFQPLRFSGRMLVNISTPNKNRS